MWKSLFGTEMKLVRVGGGMETSNFAVSYPSMQIFTFGPNVSDAHTINEHVEISSIEHAWTYLLELLRVRLNTSQLKISWPHYNRDVNKIGDKR